MARKRARAGMGPAAVRAAAQRWAETWARGLSPTVRAHLRAAGRELLLALAALCEDLLRGAEERTRRVRRRVERIPIARGRPRPES